MPQTETELEQTKFFFAHRLETYKSMIAFSTEFIKYSALLNGGAAAGTIAGLDRLKPLFSPCGLKTAIMCFLFGLISNGIGAIFSYCTQNVLYGESIRRPGVGDHRIYMILAAVFYVGSLLLFCAGGIVAVVSMNF